MLELFGIRFRNGKVVLSILSIGCLAFASLSAQNVGIGRSNPFTKLHVAGWIRSDSLAGPDSALVIADPLGTLRRFEFSMDPNTVLLGNATWGPAPGGGGSGGPDWYHPDDHVTITPITLAGTSFPYTVPVGKNLYITNVHNNVGNTTNSLEINAITMMIGYTNRGDQDAMGAFLRPLLAGPGDVISGKTTTNFNGYLVDKQVTPVSVNLVGATYTVPVGKTLVITSYCSSGGFGSFLRVNGINVFEGFSLFRGEAARNSHLEQAIFVAAGSVVSSTHVAPNLATINGYLR
ncbi:MAG: hypothetical protein IPN95_05685 [Bacteroidetes bacterium]|nr:hypothetical protein [Bacteroidota bacterium]